MACHSTFAPGTFALSDDAAACVVPGNFGAAAAARLLIGGNAPRRWATCPSAVAANTVASTRDESAAKDSDFIRGGAIGARASYSGFTSSQPVSRRRP